MIKNTVNIVEPYDFPFAMPIFHARDLLPSIERIPDCSSFPKTAVLTCDIEQDHGGRVGSYELLETPAFLTSYLDWCKSKDVPVSAFVVTSLLGQYPILRLLQEKQIDTHAHSHFHVMPTYYQHTREEILQSQEVFRTFFGHSSLGYRAPQGIVMPGDDDTLTQAGFSFDASLFPARRFHLFDYRALPRTPWLWKSGVWEIPSGTAGRWMMSITYLKILGQRFWSRLLNDDDLPRILVIDSHLHDFFPVATRRTLPLPMRLLYRRNSEGGFALLSWLMERLREKGYVFTDMSTLFRRLTASFSFEKEQALVVSEAEPFLPADATAAGNGRSVSDL